MGSTQADRALDGPNLVVRLGHGRAGLFDALPMVPSGKVARYSSRKKCSHTPNLAHGNDLMFDHTMRARAAVRKTTLW